MDRLLFLWIGNKCPLHDLENLVRKLKGTDDEALKEALSSRSSYINLIYGKKIRGISLSETTDYQEEILIYAITANKRVFLRLVEENFEAFSSLPSESILFSAFGVDSLLPRFLYEVY